MERHQQEFYRGLLEVEQRQLTAEAREIQDGLGQSQKESVQELSSYDNHPADSGSETFEREKDLSLRGNLDRRLQEINKALGRIEQDQYGTCASCGGEIPPDRLRANPAALYCIRCQEADDGQADTRRRPVEEEPLSPPFGRTFKGLDKEGTEGDGGSVIFDGEDTWQAVARFGTSSTPQDIAGDADYDRLYVGADEDVGAVEDIEEMVDDQGDLWIGKQRRPRDPKTERRQGPKAR